MAVFYGVPELGKTFAVKTALAPEVVRWCQLGAG